MSSVPFAGSMDSASLQRDSQPLQTSPFSLFLIRLNSVLHSDFCPSVNRWVYWVKRPIWCLVMALMLSLAVGIVVNTQVLLLTGILMIVGILGTILPWIMVRGLECHIRLDQQRSRVGNALLVRLRIRNRFPWPAWGLSLIRGFCGDSGNVAEESGGGEGISLACIPGWTTREFTWTFVPGIHGQYPLQPPELETGFPFGLIRCVCPVKTDGRTIVWPAPLDLAGLPDAAIIRCHDNTTADQTAGDFGDLLGTRFFRHGDSLRRIHWVQTARQQKLIVCERQALSRSQVRLLVDVTRGSHPERDVVSNTGSSSMELVIRVAASICESLHQQQCLVELLIGTEAPIISDNLQSFRRQMDAISTATVLNSDDHFRKICGQSAGTKTLLVTTPQGLTRLRNLRKDIRMICAGEELHAAGKSTAGVPWLRISDRAALSSQFPQLWRGACRVG